MVLLLSIANVHAQRRPAPARRPQRAGGRRPVAQVRYDLVRPGERFTELPPVPGVADAVRREKDGRPYGTEIRADEILIARKRNLELCSLELQPNDLEAFDLNATHFPASARFYQCAQRSAPHSGALYVTGLVSHAQLERLYSDWPTEPVLVAMEKLFHSHGELQGQARLGSDMSIRPNSTRVITDIERMIDGATGLRVGKYAHKRYDLDPKSGSQILNPLHHDGNGNCCGVTKGAASRVLTMLLYTLNDGIRGAHTLFPFLKSAAPGFVERHANDRHWNEVQDIYIKRPIVSNNPQGPSVTDWVHRKCIKLARDDSEGKPADPNLLGIRPAAGDAILFWMKNPPGLASQDPKPDPYQFHCSCPILNGTKDGIQKFIQTHHTQPGWKTSYDD